MKYFWHGNALLEEWSRLHGIQSMKIATAYFSSYGLELIQEIASKNKISKDKLELFLSPLFSYQQPSALLKEARKVATVYIVEPIPFHAKVYWLRTKSGDEQVIFGSSNFTKGGFERNIEFDVIKEIQETDESKKFEMFFDFCRNGSKKVDDDTIDTYRENEKELEELLRREKQMKKKMLSHSKGDDPFEEGDYDLSDSYFKYEDYELLFPRNQQRKDSNISKQREQLQAKLLQIHKNIYLSKVKPQLGLECHKRARNISSLIKPCEFNKYKVGWIGVRYGKTAAEVDYLNEGAGNKNDEFAFQKHACLQFSITPSGFSVNLFHAVANGAFDRKYVHEKLINDSSYKGQLIEAIQRIKGEGFVWRIVDMTSNEYYEFYIDDRNSNDFITFYNEHDKDGRESFLSYVFEPDRQEIKTIQAIEESILLKMHLLLPLYQLMALRISIKF